MCDLCLTKHRMRVSPLRLIKERDFFFHGNQHNWLNWLESWVVSLLQHLIRVWLNAYPESPLVLELISPSLEGAAWLNLSFHLNLCHRKEAIVLPSLKLYNCRCSFSRLFFCILYQHAKFSSICKDLFTTQGRGTNDNYFWRVMFIEKVIDTSS